MPSISNLISSAHHLLITEYTLEYCLYDKQGCTVYAKIGRGVRTPDIYIKRNNIRGELLQWMDLPVINHLYKAHYLSIDNTQAYIDTDIRSLEELMSNLPAVNEDTIMKKSLVIGKDKDKDKGQIFDRFKVRMELIYDGSNNLRWVYSNKMVGAKESTAKYEVEELQQRS